MMVRRFDTVFKIPKSLSLAQSALKVKKIVKFVKFRPLIFLNCKSTCDLTDVPTSIYERKGKPNFLKQSTTFYDVSVLKNLFSKAEMRQFCTSDGLRSLNNFSPFRNRLNLRIFV